MELQERINALESRQLELQARIAASDRAALDYVKGLSGFKKAYPEFAADFTEAAAEAETVTDEVTEARSEWILHIGEPVKAGDIIVHNGVYYRVLQDHTLQADWEPGQVPALYVRVDDPADEWPEFVQPTGAHDAYAKGAKVTYKGQHYISLIDANVYSPEAYPQGWQLVD